MACQPRQPIIHHILLETEVELKSSEVGEKSASQPHEPPAQYFHIGVIALSCCIVICTSSGHAPDLEMLRQSYCNFPRQHGRVFGGRGCGRPHNDSTISSSLRWVDSIDLPGIFTMTSEREWSLDE